MGKVGGSLMSPFEMAVEDHLESLPETMSVYSRSQRKYTLRRFEKVTGRRTLEAIEKGDYEKLVDGVSPSHAKSLMTHFRAFVRWAYKRYGTAVYLPPTVLPARQYRRGPSVSVLKAARTLRTQNTLKDVAARMVLPHQRLIFLLGFLHGWSLMKVFPATIDDLLALPQRDDFSLQLERILDSTPSRSRLFEIWVPSARTLKRRWLEWSGKVPFSKLNEAGEHARALAGIRPSYVKTRDKVRAALPPLNGETILRMPRFWGL